MSSRIDPLRVAQVNAINAYKEHFNENGEDRAIICMCCGSGKTRTIYEIIKKTPGIIFVIPTSRLVLIDQIYKNFNHWISLEKLNYSIQKSCTGFNIEDRLSDIISNTLSNRPTIILATYQGLGKLSGILSKSKIPIDLIIYDEAHNTVGDEGKNAQITILCDDGSLEIKRQLFMTATPVNFCKYGNYSTNTGVDTTFTMSNVATYGPVIYEYNIKDAVKAGDIVNWDVYTLKVSTDESSEIIRQYISREGEYDDCEKYRHGLIFLAEQIDKLIHDHRLDNLIVYLRGQNEINDLYETITANKDYKVNPVRIYSGAPNEKSVLKHITENHSPKKQVILAYAMLDEGIDIPSCDSILFIKDEKRENTIIQRIGRALRLNGHQKTRAKIFIPNILSDGEHQMLNKSFDKIREVLKKLNGEKPMGFCHRFFTKKSDDAAALPSVKMIKKKDLPALSDDDIAITKSFASIIQAIKDDPDRIANISLAMIKDLVIASGVDSLGELSKLLLDTYGLEIFPHEIEGFISYADLFGRETANFHEFCLIVKKLYPGKTLQQFTRQLKLDLNENKFAEIITVPLKPELYYKDYVDGLNWPFQPAVKNFCIGVEEKTSEEKEGFQVFDSIATSLLRDISKIPNDKYFKHYTKINITPIKSKFKCDSISINLIKNNSGRIMLNRCTLNMFVYNVPHYYINLQHRIIKPMNGSSTERTPDLKNNNYVQQSDPISTILDEVVSEIMSTYVF